MGNNITIYDDYFCIGDITYSKMPSLNELQRIYGKGRLTKSKNELAKSDIYTFDDVGVCAYIEDGITKQITLLYLTSKIDLHPKEKYSYPIKIKDHNIESYDSLVSIENSEVFLDEWEDDGAVTVAFEHICLNAVTDKNTKKIQEISFWFTN